MHKTGNGHGISSTVTLLGRLWLYSRLWRHFVDCDVCFSLTVTLVRRMWRCNSRQWRHFVDCDIVLTNFDVCIRWLWRLFVLTVTPVCVDCEACLCRLWRMFMLIVTSVCVDSGVLCWLWNVGYESYTLVSLTRGSRILFEIRNLSSGSTSTFPYDKWKIDKDLAFSAAALHYSTYSNATIWRHCINFVRRK